MHILQKQKKTKINNIKIGFTLSFSDEIKSQRFKCDEQCGNTANKVLPPLAYKHFGANLNRIHKMCRQIAIEFGSQANPIPHKTKNHKNTTKITPQTTLQL